MLGGMDYREADRIMTLFTLEHGKIRGIARGAKRSMRRFGGCLELFARLRVGVVVRDGLSTIDRADLVSIYPGIRSDLGGIALAGYACELVDRFIPEGLPNARLFRLLNCLLEHLDSVAASHGVRRFFEANLLNILGYRLPLDSCSNCGGDLGVSGRAAWAPSAGGFLCGACARGERPVLPQTLHFLEAALMTGRFGGVVAETAVLVEAGQILDSAIQSHLDRPLKSLAFLREILPG